MYQSVWTPRKGISLFEKINCNSWRNTQCMLFELFFHRSARNYSESARHVRNYHAVAIRLRDEGKHAELFSLFINAGDTHLSGFSPSAYTLLDSPS